MKATLNEYDACYNMGHQAWHAVAKLYLRVRQLALTSESS